MKWTISGSNDLDEILIFLADGREVYAMESLDNGGYRFDRATTWKPGSHTLGHFRQTARAA